MRKLGLIGGTSWQSTATYYKLLNERVATKLGGLHSARLVLSSVDFAQYEPLLAQGEWLKIGAMLATEARILQQAGVDAILLCTNTMHKVADQIMDAIHIPFIDIRVSTGRAICAKNCKSPLFLGTRYSMEDLFFTDVLRDSFLLKPLTPNETDRLSINAIIFEELCQGVTHARSKAEYLRVIAAGKAAGADSVIFGCTEIGILIDPSDCDIPVFDTTSIHVDNALDFAFE